VPFWRRAWCLQGLSRGARAPQATLGLLLVLLAVVLLLVRVMQQPLALALALLQAVVLPLALPLTLLAAAAAATRACRKGRCSTVSWPPSTSRGSPSGWCWRSRPPRC